MTELQEVKQERDRLLQVMETENRLAVAYSSSQYWNAELLRRESHLRKELRIRAWHSIHCDTISDKKAPCACGHQEFVDSQDFVARIEELQKQLILAGIEKEALQVAAGIEIPFTLAENAFKALAFYQDHSLEKDEDKMVLKENMNWLEMTFGKFEANQQLANIGGSIGKIEKIAVELEK